MGNRLAYLFINITDLIIFILFISFGIIQMFTLLWLPIWIVRGKWLWDYMDTFYEFLYKHLFKNIKKRLRSNNYKIWLD